MPHNDNQQHVHHLHQFDDYHYDDRTHDNYPRHHHQWAGNHHFDTVHDNTDNDMHTVHDDGGADDHELDTPGDDHQHPGFDLHWPNHNSRTTQPPDHTVTGVAVAADRGR